MKPVYVLIRDTLKRDIQNQKYPVGSLIPSERELAQTYQVTRATVQKAITHLEQEGLVKKIVGKGTFVSRTFAPPVYLLNPEGKNSALGVTQELSEKATITSQLIYNVRQPAGELLASQFGVNADEPVHAIRRIRLFDGVPALIEDSYIPRSVVAVIDNDTLENHSLYTFIENACQQKIGGTDSEISASLFNQEMARLLRIPVNSPMLHIKERTWLADGTIFNYSWSYNRGDLFRMHSRKILTP
ncbi:GntR family transcriptional regulator [Citrobacter amalonaticus]|uniref:GntR family transcriptional regulator n=1 Tax=Citrobacter amalonaticus TaxID=35703 RepID=A0A2S4RQ07_CITAM|nr:GntR family transcriptional regulator [Citrobacter amalonaticus]POT55347.1 GntR family transcriptional regulator [Citrobacter amalonaticus]POT69036.1 GntR family transcriptional regulator [Citrobacter amalonaticus]POU59263.1 GntR family transcriptional regulator [Citrobacter amalonaticus]POV03418.1 GntR family transcriptional regulator [Citrobacter amalonaticus]